MKKLFFSYILFSLALLACFARVKAQGTQVEANLSQQTIRIGDQIKLRLVAHQPVKDHINFPKLADTIVGKVQIVGAPKIDTVLDPQNKGQAIVTQTYIITSFDEGTYTIPAFSFGTAGGVLKSNELTLQVQTVKVDTTKAIYDIKQPFAVSYTFWDWIKDNWYWIAVPLLVILAVIGFIIYWRKRPKKEVIAEAIKPTIPAHETAITKLKELKEKKLWQQDEVKQYYIELSDVLREYLEKRYVIKTHEKTTDEIFTGLRSMPISQENKNLLKQILVLSDLVKFAKQKPVPEENEQIMQDAIAFVLSTKQAEAKINTEGGGANGSV